MGMGGGERVEWMERVTWNHIVVVVQSPSCFRLFVTSWTAASQASLSLTISRSSCSSHLWYHPAISSSDALFSFYPQSFPASGSFLVSCVCIRWQNIGASASASVLPASIQGWFPLRLTDLISLQSKGYRSNGNIYTTIYKIDSQWGFAVWLRNVKLGLYKNLEGLDGIGDEREI